ncbi:uncharacterized protein [Phyllobates terribilis]|uniref:uncharacterized protein n=1 Tax=Phyllobates terribilis TaxID=111132 RepID=UPI003CCAAAF9
MSECCFNSEDPLVTWERGRVSYCGLDINGCVKMSDRNLAKVDNMHLYGSPECARTMEAESLTVLKPSKTAFIADSGLKEEESYSEVDIPPSKCEQYFSTPVQILHKGGSSILDLQENPPGYKSFFSLECNEIIEQLKSKAAQGWSASKRKLEELDISTIEAEPLPLLYCTPKSVLNETTCSAKRSRIDYQGDKHFSVLSSLIKHKSPGLRTSITQRMAKIHKYVLHKIRSGHRNSTREKRSPHLNSAGHIKRSLFVRKSRTAHPQSSLLAKEEKSVPRERKSEPWIYKKGNFQNYESSTPALEFRSFFAAECDRICKQLKRYDTERIMFSNVSSIAAEPPPDLSANSTITLELGSTCGGNSVGVCQLDLEKMNINYSITEREVISQTAPDNVLWNSNAPGRKVKMMAPDAARDSVKIYDVANVTQEIYNEASADGAKPEIQIIHNQYPIADVTQEMSTMHVLVNEAKAMQGIVKTHKEMSLSPADASHANVSISNVIPCIVQDTVKDPTTLPVVNATQDIITCDVSIAHGTQVVTKGNWSERNAIQDNLTCSKAPVPEDPTGASNYSIANDTKDIRQVCNASPAVEAMRTIGTVCCKNSAADATLGVMGMINEVCATAETQEVAGTLAEVDVIVDTGTMWGTGIDPENKTTNIFHACPQNPGPRNLMAVDAPLQNVTLVKTDANVVNCLQNIVSVHPEITPDSAAYKTFTHCKVAESNVTYDVSVDRGTIRNGVQDWTRLIGHKDALNIPADISVIDEMPKMNATHTVMSFCNEVTGIDSGDITKVIATNCTVFDLSKNVDSQVNRPDIQSRHMWPITALAQSSPKRSMCNLTDLTYNMDLTDIARDKNVFYNRPIPFITSTPLPSLGNHMFIKKSCGLPVKSKPKMIGNQQDNISNITVEQMTVMPQLSGQSLAGGARIRGGTSQVVQYPKILKRATPKVMASRMPHPSPRSTLALSIFKTPQVTSAVASQKDPGALGRTHMRPPLAPTNLPRKTMPHGQPCKSGSSSSIVQQQTPVNSLRADKDFFKVSTLDFYHVLTSGIPSFMVSS